MSGGSGQYVGTTENQPQPPSFVLLLAAITLLVMMVCLIFGGCEARRKSAGRVSLTDTGELKVEYYDTLRPVPRGIPAE